MAMSKELMSLGRLNRVEAQNTPFRALSIAKKEYQEEITPLINQGIQVPIWAAWTSSQLEDFPAPIQTTLNNTGNLILRHCFKLCEKPVNCTGPFFQAGENQWISLAIVFR
jgi:hypothetical protein